MRVEWYWVNARTLIQWSVLLLGIMASTTRENQSEGVEFIHEDDGRITARDIETGVASYGETKAEALAMLAEALELHAGGGEPVSDEDLREFGLEPDDTGSD